MRVHIEDADFSGAVKLYFIIERPDTTAIAYPPPNSDGPWVIESVDPRVPRTTPRPASLQLTREMFLALADALRGTAPRMDEAMYERFIVEEKRVTALIDHLMEAHRHVTPIMTPPAIVQDYRPQRPIDRPINQPQHDLRASGTITGIGQALRND